MRRALVLLLTLSCCSCAPSPVLQLGALNPGSTWTHGSVYAIETKDALEWRVAFDGMEQDDLVFTVAAWNGSTRPRLVDPNMFSCTVARSNGKMPRGLARSIPARDPERVLAEVSTRESSILADQRTAETLSAVAGLLELTNDLVSGAKRTDEEQRRIDLERSDRTEQYDRDQRERENQLYALAQKRDAWSWGPLRRTQVMPGDSVAGRVYFAASGFAGLPARRAPRAWGLTSSTSETAAAESGEWFLLVHVADGSSESAFRYSLAWE
jgi:hypothetical protein